MQRAPDLKDAGFRTLFDRVVQNLLAHPKIVGISLHGSMIYGEQDAHSDVDLDILVDRTWEDLETFKSEFPHIANAWPPPDADLLTDHRALLETEWGFRVIGPYLFDLNFEPFESFTEPRIAQVLSGELLDTIGIRDLIDGRILYDPKGLIAGYKRQLRDYPDCLAKRILEARRRSIRIARKQAKSAIARMDPLTARQAGLRLVEDVGHLFFAHNRTWHPGGKGLLKGLACLEALPPNLVPQLRQILEVELSESMNRFDSDLDRLYRTIQSTIREG